MIKFENVEIVGWKPAIRGMRNPKNSWDHSDTLYLPQNLCDDDKDFERSKICGGYSPVINDNDYSLMTSLSFGGPVHAKYRRMIVVYVDITAPLYWWKEFDTYKVGTVSNSCSTMHKIADKEFTLEDFSCEHVKPRAMNILKRTVDELNLWRRVYNEGYPAELGCPEIPPKNKDAWWQMIQLLPSSYNQRRTEMMNYEVLANMYKWRRNHKLDEWREFCKWIESLPYSEIVMGESDINPLDTSANVTSVNFDGLDGLKKIAPDIIPD